MKIGIRCHVNMAIIKDIILEFYSHNSKKWCFGSLVDYKHYLKKHHLKVNILFSVHAVFLEITLKPFVLDGRFRS